MESYFVERLEKVLERGARVVISLTEAATADSLAIDLERLRARFPRLQLLSGRREQTHHVVCDSAFAVVTNRPLLSNLAKIRTFHHVVGYLLQRPDLVEAFVERVDPLRSVPRGAVRPSFPGGPL